MKIVGLRIEKGFVSASTIVRWFNQEELTDSFSRSFSTDAELVEILKEKAAAWAGAKIISSIPGHFFSQRVVAFPFADRKRVEKALSFEIEDNVPFPLEEVVIDHVTIGAKKSKKEAGGLQEIPVLGVMLPKAIIRAHLSLLSAAGIDPQVIVPSYIGLYALSRMIKTEGSTLLVCGKDLCMKDGEGVKALRSYSDSLPTAGLRHTLQAMETEQKELVEKALVLCADGAAQEAFGGLGIAVEQVMPEFKGKKAEDPLSLGLALADQPNFRKGEFAYRLADVGARRRKQKLIIAGAAAALLAAVNLGVKFFVVQSSYGRLDKEIKEIYRQTFPDAKAAADPVRQMRDKLDDARKKLGVLGTGSSALDVMKAVTEGVPKEVRVSFLEFNLEGDRLKLQGETSSFEAVDKMKAELQKAAPFAEVVVQDTRMGVENKVKFRMEMKLKQAM